MQAFFIGPSSRIADGSQLGLAPMEVLQDFASDLALNRHNSAPSGP